MDQPTEPHPIFDNELLLDTILERVVQIEWRVMTGDLKNCRLVNKAFLRSINRVFRKHKTPLFHFHLHEEPQYYNGPNVLIKGNELVQFIDLTTENLHSDHPIPLYTLKNGGRGPQPNANRIILHCLQNWGNELVELNLRLSELQVPFPPNNNLSLPMLNRFAVKLHWYIYGRVQTNGMSDKINFMQSVFDASPHLKWFTLDSADFSDNIEPDTFGSLLLAPSITQLHFSPPLKDCHLQTLISSSFRNLNSLTFSVCNRPARDGLITRILENVQKTLGYLYVRYAGRVNQVEGPIIYKLPLMEKLKYLLIENMYPSSKLEEHDSSFANLVPMLSLHFIPGAKQSMVKRWTDNLYLPSVTSVEVSKAYGQQVELSIDLATMQALHRSLPNLKELHILSGATDMAVFIFIMKQMRNLHTLQITVQNGDRLARSPDCWDAILIGIPKESAEALRKSPDLWERLQTESDVSIRNLAELETLHLNTARSSDSTSFISEIAFHYAFLKMPKLTNLILGSGFCTTREISGIWEAEGRSIKAHYCEHDGNQSDLDHEDEGENSLGYN